MGTITTSLVIDFDAGDAEGILKAEIDDRDDGYNDGETSFIPGDAPAWLLYASSNVTVAAITSSLGSNAVLGTGSVEVNENLTFENAREVTPSYPISSGLTTKWLGTNGGVVSSTENKITIPSLAVAVLNCVYNATFTAYRLSNIPTSVEGETTFPVVIYINGTVV